MKSVDQDTAILVDFVIDVLCSKLKCLDMFSTLIQNWLCHLFNLHNFSLSFCVLCMMKFSIVGYLLIIGVVFTYSMARDLNERTVLVP